MLEMADEELLKCIKESQSEFNTMAEIHKILLQKNINCTIEYRFTLYLMDDNEKPKN